MNLIKRFWILCLFFYVNGFIFAQQHTRDEAIRAAAQYLEWRLPLYAPVAVVYITAEDPKLSETVINELIECLVNNNKVRVVARDKASQEQIKQEIDLQLREGSEESLVSLGEKIGAQFIITGSIVKQESEVFRLRIHAVSVETAIIQASEKFDFKDISEDLPQSLDESDSLDKSDIKVDYLIKQITFEQSSEIQEGELYIEIGFQSYSTLVNIDQIDKVVDLPPPGSMMPKNICFVIDISGSMDTLIGPISRLEWIKQVFTLIINDKIKPEDFISLVVFNHNVEVIFEQWQIKNNQDRKKCLDQVISLNPDGGTAIAPGLLAGYRIVEKTFQDNYINRVVLLTDGETGESDKSDGRKYVREYMNKEISTVSTIALSREADKDFMTYIAKQGGGISLFIDHYETPEIFANRIGWLIAGSQEDIRKEVPYGVNISLTSQKGVVLQKASEQGLINFSESQAQYNLLLKDREYKTLWVKAELSPEGVKNNDILQLAISRDGKPVSYYITLGLDPLQISTFNQIRILSIYHAFP